MSIMRVEKIKDEVQANDPGMGLVDAIYERRSVRGFLNKEVPQEVLNRIFEIAQKAPSNCNVQPWKVYVASGELKDKLKRKMVENVTSGVEANPDLSLIHI